MITDLWELGRDHVNYLRSRYLRPQPRDVLIGALRTYATAAMDVSDSLAGACPSFCHFSNGSIQMWWPRTALVNQNSEPAANQFVHHNHDGGKRNMLEQFCRDTNARDSWPRIR